ncbi:MAG: ribonuclease E/G [Sneathiella sp.]|nr:ribonuclease E/G [Sneathiella sp.]
MKRQLLIDEGVFVNRALLLRDEQPQQFTLENTNSPSMVQAVFMGRVASHLNDISAAFIDLGGGKSALLKAQDWDGAFDKSKPFSSQLTEGSLLPVRVIKDPIEDKPFQVTNFLNLEHPLLHLRPYSSNIQFAKSFKDETKKDILQRELLAFPAGFLLRSNAVKAPAESVLQIAGQLYQKWEKLEVRIKSTTAPTCLMPPPSFTERIINQYGHQADEISITPASLIASVKNQAPEVADCIQANVATISVVDPNWTSDFLETRLPLAGGGHVSIEPTEALVSIDVNAAGMDRHAANRQAAKLIAQELRLRNLSGMILIDFAGQQTKEETRELSALLKNASKIDVSRIEIYGSSALGLMQMTRQRLSPPLKSVLSEINTEKGVKIAFKTLFSLEMALLHEVENKPTRRIKITAGNSLYLHLAAKQHDLSARYNLEITLINDDNLAADAYSLGE